MSLLPICVASRMRWLSPPESVAEERSRVRYPTPTSSRKLRRSEISCTTFSAMARSRLSRFSFATQARRSETGRLDSSSMALFLTVTARASGRRRRPLQARQGWTDMYFSISARIAGESVSLWRRSSMGMTPSYVPVQE